MATAKAKKQPRECGSFPVTHWHDRIEEETAGGYEIEASSKEKNIVEATFYFHPTEAPQGEGFKESYCLRLSSRQARDLAYQLLLFANS